MSIDIRIMYILYLPAKSDVRWIVVNRKIHNILSIDIRIMYLLPMSNVR